MKTKGGEGRRTAAVIRPTRFVLPVVLALIGFAIAYYVIAFPYDRMVSNYVTPEKTIASLIQLLRLSGISMLLAVVTAVPLGAVLTFGPMRRFAGVVISIVNVFQAVPALAVIAFVFTFLGIGEKTAIVALWLYSLLPIVNNTYAGIMSVDPSVREAARGLGMRRARVFFRVDVPLALPAIISGIRTALIINIGTAVVAAFVGAGGLGDYIIAGKAINRPQMLIIGGGLTAITALIIDSLISMAEDVAAKRASG